MDTQEILDLAIALAQQTSVPADTGIDVPATDVQRALFGIDVDAADLSIAKERGYDLEAVSKPFSAPPRIPPSGMG